MLTPFKAHMDVVHGGWLSRGYPAKDIFRHLGLMDNVAVLGERLNGLLGRRPHELGFAPGLEDVSRVLVRGCTEHVGGGHSNDPELKMPSLRASDLLMVAGAGGRGVGGLNGAVTLKMTGSPGFATYGTIGAGRG